ncbi:MAG: oligosaccharide flippase family protein [Bacteroidia bacterium]
MGVLKKLASQSAWYGLSSILGRGLYFLLTPFYTRTFVNPQSFGIMSSLYAYMSFANVLYTYGLETSYFYFSEREDTKKVYNTALSSILITSLLFTVLLIAGSDIFANFIKLSTHPEYVLYVALILAFDALSAIPFALLRRQQRPRKFVAIKLSAIAINIGLNLFFLWLCPKWLVSSNETLRNFTSLIYNPTLGVEYVFIVNIFSSGLTLLLLYKEILQCSWKPNFKLLKSMLIYSAPLLVAGFAGMINETLDRIILSFMIHDPNEALRQQGIYGANYKISMLMSLYILTFRFAAEPFFFAKQKEANVREVYAYVMKYFVLGCTLIFLAVMLYLNIFKYFIGSDKNPVYWEGLHVVPILLLANLCLGVYINQSMWYKWSGQTKFGAWFSVFGAVITIVLNIILVPRIGYTGCAWTTLICYASMMMISYFFGRHYYPVNYDLKRILGYIFFAIGLVAVSKFIQGNFDLSFISSILFNTLLLILFVSIAWSFERPKKA